MSSLLRPLLSKSSRAHALLSKQQLSTRPTMLRYNFDDLESEMSSRVRKLFELTNGNQREVVKAQKAQGIALILNAQDDVTNRPDNTGDSAAQVIALTTRIQQVQTHLASHRKDHSSKRGLNRMYVRRRKLLDYMERKDFDAYRLVVKTLGLQRS